MPFSKNLEHRHGKETSIKIHILFYKIYPFLFQKEIQSEYIYQSMCLKHEFDVFYF